MGENKLGATSYYEEFVGDIKYSIDVTAWPTLEAVEEQYLRMVLKKVHDNKAEAAKILGLTTKTIYNRIEFFDKKAKE